MINFSVTQYGKPLDKSKYNWDKKTKTFSTIEDNLILDFSEVEGVTFKTGLCCAFKTGSECTFKTGSYCTFKTGSECAFKTGLYCTFKTGSDCIFKTGSNCTFDTGSNCVVVRSDIFEVIQLTNEENHIKLNLEGVKGYKDIEVKHVITIDGKDVELSKESYENLKKQLV